MTISTSENTVWKPGKILKRMEAISHKKHEQEFKGKWSDLVLPDTYFGRSSLVTNETA
jgi:hypothetical protein